MSNPNDSTNNANNSQNSNNKNNNINDNQVDENEQIRQRREKLAQLREIGNPFPNTFRPENAAESLHAELNDLSKEQLEEKAIEVVVAGRLMTRRIMGKASFANLQDETGQIQVYVQRDALPEGFYNEQFKKWDIGDIIGAKGVVFKTNKG